MLEAGAYEIAAIENNRRDADEICDPAAARRDMITGSAGESFDAVQSIY